MAMPPVKHFMANVKKPVKNCGRKKILFLVYFMFEVTFSKSHTRIMKYKGMENKGQYSKKGKKVRVMSV